MTDLTKLNMHVKVPDCTLYKHFIHENAKRKAYTAKQLFHPTGVLFCLHACNMISRPAH